MLNDQTDQRPQKEWEAEIWMELRLSALNGLARVGDSTRPFAARKLDSFLANKNAEFVLRPDKQDLHPAGEPDTLPQELFWTADRIARRYVDLDESQIIYSDWEERLQLVYGLSWIMCYALWASEAGTDGFDTMLDAMARLGNLMMRVADQFIRETSDHDPEFPRLKDADLSEQAVGIARLLFAEVDSEWRKSRE